MIKNREKNVHGYHLPFRKVSLGIKGTKYHLY